MDARRVVMALDKLNIEGREDEGARLLEKWRDEAKCEHDEKSELTIVSEMLGQYRRTGEKEKGLLACRDAVDMVYAMSYESTATGATILVNAATTLKAFGKTDESFNLFKKCEKVYEKTLTPDDYRFSALYNNMALTYADLGDFGGASEYFFKALESLEKIDNSDCDRACTWCNLAELYDNFSEDEEKINEFMENAFSCLTEKNTKKDSYLAYTIDRCLPTFDYFGFFLYSRKLREIRSLLDGDKNDIS